MIPGNPAVVFYVIVVEVNVTKTRVLDKAFLVNTSNGISAAL
ncbi:hypothetical protein [Pedobacter sp. R20-19]|nr:hypothetical protein [Pedobacter sp. R20-19]